LACHEWHANHLGTQQLGTRCAGPTQPLAIPSTAFKAALALCRHGVTLASTSHQELVQFCSRMQPHKQHTGIDRRQAYCSCNCMQQHWTSNSTAGSSSGGCAATGPGLCWQMPGYDAVAAVSKHCRHSSTCASGHGFDSFQRRLERLDRELRLKRLKKTKKTDGFSRFQSFTSFCGVLPGTRAIYAGVNKCQHRGAVHGMQSNS
jgi:hypothetical protein